MEILSLDDKTVNLNCKQKSTASASLGTEECGWVVAKAGRDNRGLLGKLKSASVGRTLMQ